jgi:hypothetical protein
MDYSIILGVIQNSQEVKNEGNKQQNNNQWNDSKGQYKYFFGIIDYLQVFDFWKQMEFRYKCIRYPLRKYQISSVKPALYSARFLDFVKNKFLQI